jgi:hypothetical protein
MFEFTEHERQSLTMMRALAQDEQGREVLVGLTIEETEELMGHYRRFPKERVPDREKQRFRELHDKHEKARLEVIGSEAYLRSHEPPRH